MLGFAVLAAAAVLGLVGAGSTSITTRPPGAVSTAGTSQAGTARASAPVFAYFYQWFTPSSWNRAKQDYPLAGRYGSDDAHVLRAQVRQARSAGIDGFLTSWKQTPALDRRLGLLIRIARSEGLDLGVVYESLDFSRAPLPVATVVRDMTALVDRWGSSLRSSYYGRPVIIWTGTDDYSTADVRTVRAALGARAYLLASSHTVPGYERVAGLVDGEAYYWSSADPRSPMTAAKLSAMSQAVHAHHGLWLAPATAGYDGRGLGGTRVISRDGGRTLVHSLEDAYATSPDGVAVISWNEWSENTYVEPGERYGQRELVDLKRYLVEHGKAVPTGLADAGAHRAAVPSGWTGAQAAAVLALLTAGAVLGLSLRSRRRARRERRPRGRPGPA